MPELLVIQPFSLGDITRALQMAASLKIRRPEWWVDACFRRSKELVLTKVR